MTRTAVLYRDFPQIAAEPDGRIWDVLYDGATACDAICPANDRLICRLPVAHDGDHLWFNSELVAESGVRFC
jgi:hypothetical protein